MLTFLWVDNQIFYKFSKNTSEITRFEKKIKFGKSILTYWADFYKYFYLLTKVNKEKTRATSMNDRRV